MDTFQLCKIWRDTMRNADNDMCLLDGHDTHDRGDIVKRRKYIGNKRKWFNIAGVFYCDIHKVLFKVIKRKNLDLMIILHADKGVKVKGLNARTDLKKQVDIHYPFTYGSEK